MKQIKNFVSDSYKSPNYSKDEQVKYVIITYDVYNANSSAYREIHNYLEKHNFMKSIKYKRNNSKNNTVYYDVAQMPKNTYTAFAGDDFKNINRLRDHAEHLIRGILDSLLEYRRITGYNYFVFTANEWSFASGEIHQNKEEQPVF